MAIGSGGFRTRAVSLLHPYVSVQNQPPGQQADLEKSPTVPPTQHAELSINEKQAGSEPTGDRKHSGSLSTAGKTLTSSDEDAVTQNKTAQRLVRTIPPWVEFLDEESQDTDPNTHLLPHSPQHAQVAQHNNSPWAKNNERLEPPRGRLPDLDGARTRRGSPTTESRWKAFTRASAYPAISANGGERVTEEWLIQNGPDYSQPWLANSGEKDEEHTFFGSKAKRKRWWIRMQRKIIRSPMIPLVLRSIVWGFSMVALALGSSIHRLTVNIKPRYTTSADMAIAVDAVALVYLLYITYDEYTGKPLGLRSAVAKIRLIFLDLFFIVFDSANLSLAMESTTHNGANGSCSSNDKICDRQKALASVLLIALIAWLLTFSISVLRLVERVTHK